MDRIRRSPDCVQLLLRLQLVLFLIIQTALVHSVWKVGRRDCKRTSTADLTILAQLHHEIQLVSNFHVEYLLGNRSDLDDQVPANTQQKAKIHLLISQPDPLYHPWILCKLYPFVVHRHAKPVASAFFENNAVYNHSLCSFIDSVCHLCVLSNEQTRN